MLFAAVLFALSVSQSLGDTLIPGAGPVRKEVSRLAEEALEVARTPFRQEDYSFFSTLGVAGAVGLTFLYDAEIREKFKTNGSRTLEKAAEAGSLLGNPYLHLGAAAALYGGASLAGSPGWREVGEMLGEAVLLADASSFLLKQSIGRGRPSVSPDKDSFRPFQFRSDYDSTPSIHTASSFAMASVLAATSESIPAAVLYYTAAAFVGLSRVYEEKHWASDVVLGAAVGELCGRVVTRFHARGEPVILVPAVGNDSVLLALQGRW